MDNSQKLINDSNVNIKKQKSFQQMAIDDSFAEQRKYILMKKFFKDKFIMWGLSTDIRLRNCKGLWSGDTLKPIIVNLS